MNTSSRASSTYDLGIGYRFWTPLTFDALGFVFGVCFGRHFAFGIEYTLEGTLLLALGADDSIGPLNYTLLLLSPLFTSLYITLGACFNILLFLLD
jgi:hypothetical protein